MNTSKAQESGQHDSVNGSVGARPALKSSRFPELRSQSELEVTFNQDGQSTISPSRWPNICSSSLSSLPMMLGRLLSAAPRYRDMPLGAQ
ncbi:hypothetical protein [Aestuariicoccus sp. MJ-SS9]|uniref:hypothetical protein n=1 Tax=Aestuariicoccus sp. MJ-SS9 TaxID=3079855 RepID=UPI0029104933|nr:hypothetical protein [Aestuariicoccus sp. MJ-SS9]MDU8911323.1 hypothetical protein [Aestuariicoccus sp. MJ-SS9]